MTTKQYKQLKGLKKENLRDNMSTAEIVLNMLAEVSTTEISKNSNPQNFKENKSVARSGGEVVRAIDADVLRQEISATVVEGPQERYQFNWPDKKKSVVLANQPIAKTLRLVREKSVGRDGLGGIDSENIYIERDNLDALKLLQETYLGKVKMIYIDMFLQTLIQSRGIIKKYAFAV